MTINELLALQKAVRSRLSELQALRNSVAVRKETNWYDRDTNKQDKIEPQYDVKFVDRKISELEMFLFKADSGIKQANAKTKVSLTADVEKLLAPLE